MKVKRLGKFWWIVGNEDFGPIGPYDTREEAETDRRGLIRFARYEDELGFVTCEK